VTAARRGLGLVVVLASAMALAVPAPAQEPTSTSPSPSTTVGLPTQDIVPQPNSGAAPQEAGDRGGALQLGVLALVVVAISGATFALVRQSRRARASG
jgi:uncharacterized protein HemX